MTAPTFPNVLVVGMHFRGADVVATVSNLIPPVEFQLEREPQNPYDEFAIKVNYQGEHIGYIERGQAAFISPQIDAGQYYSCTVDGMQQKGKNLHPKCTLAPAERPEKEEPDLFADPDDDTEIDEAQDDLFEDESDEQPLA